MLTIAPSAVPGTSHLTFRARASGVPDATANLDLTVTEARIDLAPSPLLGGCISGIEHQKHRHDRPIDMSPPDVPTKIVRGRGEHLGANQTWFYAHGGGTASSTNFAPDFSIVGVGYGEQDFLGWTPFGTGYRGVVRRNVDIPDGQSLPESVNLLGPEAFAAAREAFTINGVGGAGESLRHTMAFRTGSACISNALYTSNGQGFGPAVFGVPLEQQESDDFHFLTVISAGSSSFRSTSVSFRVLQARTIALPPVITTPVLVQ